MKSIVVIGGGTGTSVVLSGLIKHPVRLQAIVSVADSGGSTGRLRDEFGFLPVGDLRQALSALAESGSGQPSWISQLLLYRFPPSSSLKGHNLGNLILTALQDLTGSTAEAVAIAGHIFRLKGQIYPSTQEKVDLVIEYQDGTYVIGEHHLNPENHSPSKIKRVCLSPAAILYPKAGQAVRDADLIVIGPGDLYASILPNLLVKGMRRAISQTPARLVYVMNLMTSHTQTPQFTAQDHLQVIETHLGRPVDHLIINRQAVDSKILKAYAKEQEHPVVDDLPQDDPRVIRADLICTREVQADPRDSVMRSFLRHDSDAVAEIIYQLIH